MALERKLKWFFGLIVLANIVIVMVVALGAFKSEPPHKPLPSPNGYDDFVKAGTMLLDTDSDYSILKPKELAVLVATNAEALKLLRVGLGRECRVPDDYSSNYVERLMPELSLQKKLAQTLCAEGKLAEIQSRTNDAAQSYLDTATFGAKCSDGGVMISKLVGLACESMGRNKLQLLVENVDSGECRKAAKSLETIDATEWSAEDTLKQEEAYAQKIGTFGQKIAALLMYQQQQKNQSNLVAKVQKNQTARRHVMLNFAARAYELEKGKPPAAIADLVPDYLKAVPKDPVTGADIALESAPH